MAVPDVDEASVTAPDTSQLVAELAQLKGETVVADLGIAHDLVLVACDSLLDVDGVAWGKPGSADEAGRRLRRLSGRSADLLTGHHVVVIRDGQVSRTTKVATTRVTFASLTDAEIDAYVATGEPERVAGSFTIDGFGAPFVARVEGDPHNVVGISLPLLREILAGEGVAWQTLWDDHSA